MNENPIYTTIRQHGIYTIEDHGANVHVLYFKTGRQKYPRPIGTFGAFESARLGIEHHSLTGYSKPLYFKGMPAINPEAKWLKNKA